MLVLDEVLEFIAKRISNLRNDRNISARELSLSIGQNKNYINTIESLTAKPSIDGLVYVCDYFNLTLAEFFDEGTNNPLQIKELHEAAKKLDTDSLNLLIETARKINGNKKLVSHF